MSVEASGLYGIKNVCFFLQGGMKISGRNKSKELRESKRRARMYSLFDYDFTVRKRGIGGARGKLREFPKWMGLILKEAPLVFEREREPTQGCSRAGSYANVKKLKC